MKEIIFCGQQMILHHQGVLLWPDQNLAVVADLHLEKGSHFARAGQFLPPFDSFETLKKLIQILCTTKTEKLILLGDSFHDEQGYHRMDLQTRQEFNHLCDSYDILWVIGNHDGAFVPENTKAFEEIQFATITFRHEAKANAEYDITGHFHPKACIRYKGQRISKPCFISNEKRMILPAFGAYTGGLDIKDKTIQNLMGAYCEIYMLGNGAIYTIPSERLGT